MLEEAGSISVALPQPRRFAEEEPHVRIRRVKLQDLEQEPKRLTRRNLHQKFTQLDF